LPRLRLKPFASTLYFKSADRPRREVPSITRQEILEQLDRLRSQGRGLFTLFAMAFVLIAVPFAIYDVRLIGLARAHSSTKAVLLLGFGLFAVWLVTALAFLVAIRRVVGRNAPACPQCSKRITWRDRDNVLLSGKCPYCDFRLFRV
jgi:hypothetical protein